jgi:hypothetical protein
LRHFAQLIVSRREQGRDADYSAVTEALGEATAPARLHRPRRTDAEISELIRTRLQSQSGIARILRALRDEEGVACEQARFSRLYRAAIVEREAV